MIKRHFTVYNKINTEHEATSNTCPKNQCAGGPEKALRCRTKLLLWMSSDVILKVQKPTQSNMTTRCIKLIFMENGIVSMTTLIKSIARRRSCACCEATAGLQDCGHSPPYFRGRGASPRCVVRAYWVL